MEDDLKDQLEDDTSEHSEDDSDNTEDDSEDDWGDDLTNALNASNGPESAAGQARKEWKMETPSWPRLWALYVLKLPFEQTSWSGKRCE